MQGLTSASHPGCCGTSCLSRPVSRIARPLQAIWGGKPHLTGAVGNLRRCGGTPMQRMPEPTHASPDSRQSSASDGAGLLEAEAPQTRDERPAPGGSLGQSAMESICDKEECPFPDHRAFSDETRRSRRLHNQVQLSCYGDSIGGDMKTLRRFLDEHLEGVVKGTHLLPIYPSSGDGGFAPTTYMEVDPRLGTWEDVQGFASRGDLELELMVNHISPQSHQFQDFLAKGDASEYSSMFVDWQKFWPGGEPSEADLLKIRTRKPEAPVITVDMADGSKRRLWCTFGPQQIDINPFSAPGRRFVEESLAALCERGAKIVRLDAFGYCTKKAGTRCFCEEPEVWTLLERLDEVADRHGARLLCEVHEEYETNLQLAAHGYWVYDFALPLLVLHAFYFHTGAALRNWLRICPRRQFTVLDTHDGMGIDDIAGLATMCDIEELQEVIEKKLGALPNYKYKRGEDGQYRGFPHQYNATFFSALGESPRRYLLARAIQLFTPGVPMIYYVGLLAGSNDPAGVATEGPRGVNRHRYSYEEAAAELQRPVVKALHAMCRMRNRHPAFNGKVGIKEESPDEDHMLRVTWRNGPHHATLRANLKTLQFDIIGSALDDGDEPQQIFKYELQDDSVTWAKSDGASEFVPTEKLKGLRKDAAFASGQDEDFEASC